MSVIEQTLVERIFYTSEEAISASICFILAWFLIKTYLATRETRHLILPLGFIFLGVSYALSAYGHSFPVFAINDLAWFQLLTRPFAFVFLTFAYYFSKKPSTTRLLWDITLSVLLVTLMSIIVLFVIAPQLSPLLTFSNYRIAGIYVKIFSIFCLVYISAHTLRSHLQAHNTKTIMTPFGFIFIGISQYSLLIWAIDGSDFAFYGGLVLRWIGLSIFLLVVYLSFYGPQKRRST
ncbi:MAG: hypothetical protein ACQCN3_00495 [Candidatus Bathyarchaeia archaeon]|jgi:hypothetical protein